MIYFYLEIFEIFPEISGISFLNYLSKAGSKKYFWNLAKQVLKFNHGMKIEHRIAFFSREDNVLSLCGRLIIFFSIESCYVMVYKAKIDIQFAEKYWLYKTWPKEILSLGNATTALITQLIDHFTLWNL